MEFIKKKNSIIYLKDNVELAHVNFPNIDEKTVDINETKVDESLRGQGIAGQLMIKAYEVIKSANLKAVLTCSYAISWFEKHPEYQDILKK